MQDIRLVHLSDVHLGYTGPASLVFREDEQLPGRYIREVDIEQAIRRLCKQITTSSPKVDIVVIAGDLFHRSAPLPRAIQGAAWFVRKLVQSQIDVVVIDGNHETSSWRHTGSPTSYLRELGAHVVNGAQYEILQGEAWHNPLLRDVLLVHALPYRAVLDAQFAGVSPVPEKMNVLLTHGRVQGLPELNTMGLQAALIPPEVVRRGWDYVALGDWHIHRHQPLGEAPAYYSGSLEALNFGEAAHYPVEAKDPNSTKGALDVILRLGKPALVTSMLNEGRRPVLRLKSIEASELEPDALMKLLRQRLDSKLPSDALVRLEIEQCPELVWKGLDHVEIEQLRSRVRRCDIQWDIRYHEVGQSEIAASEETLEVQWGSFAASQLEGEDDQALAWYTEQGAARIKAGKEQVQGSKLLVGED